TGRVRLYRLVSWKGFRKQLEKHASVADHADRLAGAAVTDFRRYRRIDIDADDLDPAWQHVPGGDRVQHGAEAQHEAGVPQQRGVRVLGLVHVGDGIRQGAVVAKAAGEDEGHIRLHALIQDA